jgi:uncharacterized protein (DUF433 family)
MVKENMMYSHKSHELMARITVDSSVMVGKPVIRGLRITVEQILKALGGGVSAADILADYPELEPQDIQAALLYASDRIENEKVYVVNG